MTDKVTELAKKHGAKFTVASNGDTYQVQNRVSMTLDQLRAIIKEASAPLVEAVNSAKDGFVFYDDYEMAYDINIVIEEFNKEFGE